jgi:hypothetical protein
MMKADQISMQCLSLEAIFILCVPVQLISQQGMPKGGQMNPYLMSSAGFQGTFNIGGIF